jgi:hypothetical protein
VTTAKLASRVASAVAGRVAASLVSRVLQRFVKKVGGEDIGTLRVKLDGSSLTLRDLDLNVDGALCLQACQFCTVDLIALSSIAVVPSGSSSVVVDRAFASELTVTVPWSRLGSDPLGIAIHDVHIVLSLRSADAGQAGDHFGGKQSQAAEPPGASECKAS